MLPYERQLALTGPRAISHNLVLIWLKNLIGEEEELQTLAATTSRRIQPTWQPGTP